MTRIIADDKIPFLKGLLEPFASVVYMNGSEINAASVHDADALLVRTRTACDEKLLKGSAVKFIATATIGFDHIDTAFCDANSIRWTNAPGCNSSSVQQYIASVFATLSLKHGWSFRDKTVGIIGVGHVGKKVEALSRALGMKVILNDPPRERKEGSGEFTALEKLLRGSDIITLHVPLNRSGTDRTWHMINEEKLKLIKPGAWLFNTSRGEVVEQDALKVALSRRIIAGTVLDVWENEPAVDPDLLSRAGIATPHIAGYSVDGKRNGTVHVVKSLAEHFGFPLPSFEDIRLPEPLNPVIDLKTPDGSPENLISRAILHTYDVSEDDFRFREAPAEFERLRGNYHARREFPAYTVKIPENNIPVTEVLRKLGFQISS